MKRILCWLCYGLTGGLLAQPAVYHAGNEWLSLTEDRHSLMIYLDKPGLAPAQLDTLGWGVADWEASHPVQAETLLVTFTQPQTLPAPALATLLLPQPGLLRTAVYGHRLPDGLLVHPTQRVVYQPAAGFQAATFQALLAAHGGTGRGQTSTGIHWATLAAIDSVWPFLQALEASGMVSWSQPDFLAEPQAAADPFYPLQFYLHNTGQTIDGVAGMNDIDIDAPEAWGFTLGSPLITVAVMDEGVAPHEDLTDGLGQSRILPGYSIIDTVNGTGAPIAAGEAHGQACAGLVAASHNTTGIRGVAPGVRILPVYMPFSPFNPLSAIADGLNWAWQNGADVMSNSWTYYTCLANPFPVLTQAIDDGLLFGRGGLGLTFVFAAGNNSSCVGFPSSLPGVLAVGAVTHTGQVAPYSNTGPSLDLVAPSAGAIDNIRTMDRMGSDGYNVTGAGDLLDINYTRRFGGTSTATALTSGGAALLLSEFPYLTQAEVRQILQQSATDMGGLGFDDSTGHGRLNLYDALVLATSLFPLESAGTVLGDPVPARTWVQVQAGRGLSLQGLPAETGPYSLRLLDMQGRTVAQMQGQANAQGQLDWPLTGLATGLYVLQGYGPDHRPWQHRLRWP